MTFKDFTPIEKIEFATRSVIILSIAYYDFDYNLVEDSKYDSRLKWVCDYSAKYPEVAKSCYYANVLKDIDPSTGFDLKYKLTDEHRDYLEKITIMAIKQHKQENLDRSR